MSNTFYQLFGSKRHGFTVVEALVAITITLLAVTSVFSVVHTSLRSASRAQNNVTAFYLAQDAFENIKNMRDTDTMSSGQDWRGRLCSGSSSCSFQFEIFDSDGELKEQETDTGCNNLAQDCARVYQYNSKPGVYDAQVNKSTSDWSASRFKRLVTIEEVNGGKEIKVKVKIQWRSADGESRNVVFTENILNWREGSA